MSRTIMHATDFSSASRAAFAKALQLARRDHAPLVIAHVMTPPVPIIGDGYVSPATWENIYRGYRKSAQRKLDAAIAKAKAAGVRARGLLLEGVPHEQILRAAKRAGLLVIGTHGRTGVARFFVGSVAGRIVAGSRCPVVTVRGK
ncbi:MAG TPA: universal stress protein [Methylomirabilota bacterium]|jgi:nucleotide-binding universal stress UspA family protein|nr:universal stress protein [Methylomirabilota bacterium]